MALSKGPGDEPAQEEDYFAKYLKGPSPDDAKFEPELQELLKKLYDRQREEAYTRIQEQDAEVIVFGSKVSMPPKILNEHREWDERQNARFALERDRHIGDHQRANAIRSDMEKSERQALEKGLDPDMPNLTR